MMSKTLGTVTFLLVLLHFCSLGQIKTDLSKTAIDSLINLTPTYQGTQLVDHLNLIATSISQRYPDSCFYYANQALDLSDSLHYEFGKAVAVFNMGNGFSYKIDVKNAMVNFLAALYSFEKLGPSQEYGNLLLQIGSINRYLENDMKAIEYCRKAKHVFDKIGNKLSCVVAFYQIGYSCIRSQQYDSAFFYMHRALNDCKKIGNLKHMTIIYDMIGITYEWRDDLKPENERNEGRFAIPYLDTCYYFAQLSGFKLYEVISLSNIGECYHHYINPPDHEKAEEYYLKALNIGAENSIYHNNAEVLAWLGELYADMGNYSKAKIYLNKALQESNEFDKQKQFTYPFFQYDRVFTDLNYSWWAKHSIYRGFMELHQYLGEFEKALTYSEKRHKTLDSLNQLKIRNQVDYMLANAENERTKQQIQLLEKENELQKNKALRSIQILAALVFVSVIMGLLLLIYIRQNKLKTEQEKINLKQKLLRSQMNPHFIFNSLASIQNAIINEDPIKASKYLSRFSKLVRNILESSVVDFIPLEEEINTIENYLALQKIRFPEKFDYSIEVDEAIDPQTVLIPPMLAQPFIENAIEHGIKHKSSKGKLVVRFKLKGGEIEYEVEDDGIGRQKAQEILHTLDHKHKSLATSITLERIIAINKNLEKKIALNIQDLYNDNKEPRGTFVMISVPLNQ